eukprot:10160886-Lingulodinium_polyedra.AAC.1
MQRRRGCVLRRGEWANARWRWSTCIVTHRRHRWSCTWRSRRGWPGCGRSMRGTANVCLRATSTWTCLWWDRCWIAQRGSQWGCRSS